MAKSWETWRLSWFRQVNIRKRTEYLVKKDEEEEKKAEEVKEKEEEDKEGKKMWK